MTRYVVSLAPVALRLGIVALAIAATSDVGGAVTDQRRVVPACQEDQVLVGTGNFEHGRWTAYACGPAVDDLPAGDCEAGVGLTVTIFVAGVEYRCSDAPYQSISTPEVSQ